MSLHLLLARRAAPRTHLAAGSDRMPVVGWCSDCRAPRRRRPARAGLGLALALWLAGAVAPAAQAATWAVDARQPPAAPPPGGLRMGSPAAAVSPAGQTWRVNNQHLSLDSRPVLPVMGEFHYSRYPRAEWETQLLKMKSAGITVVASYLVWRHHEPEAGRFDWAGERDLRHFVQLAQRHGLRVYLRPGPWVHAELRFGGLPDWLVDAVPTRRDDPDYLRHVERFFAQVAQQVRGLLWRDGGPVIGVQVENEYNRVGPGQGAAHIATLKRLLLAQGLDVPLYTVTGWDNAVWPAGEVVPVFGSYVDEPWSARAGVLPPKTSYLFQFGVRNEQGLGAQGRTSNEQHAERDADITPFFGAEYGAGVPQMYRRRPLIAPEDIHSMVITKLGSGVNLLGYYMFHGGRNPPGALQDDESIATGGFNDVPRINYDFQAPLGQYGDARPVLHALRPLHLFLQAFGDRLAPMAVYPPQQRPAAADDLATLRWAFRGDGRSGFVFVNNHVRQHATPAHAGTRFEVQLASGTITLPSQPVTVQPGQAFIWPVNLVLDSAGARGGASTAPGAGMPHPVRLAWATAQPVTVLHDAQGPITVFAASGPQAEAPEFVFEHDQAVAVQWPGEAAPRAALLQRWMAPNQRHQVLRPPAGQVVQVRNAAGAQARWVWWPEAQLRQMTLLPLSGRPHLVWSTGEAFAQPDGRIAVQQDQPGFAVGVFPPPAALPPASLSLQPLSPAQAAAAGLPPGMAHGRAVAPAWPAEAQPVLTLLRPALPLPAPLRHGPRQTVVQPTPETFGLSAAWRLQLPEVVRQPPPELAPHLAGLWLDLALEGDVARLFSGATLLDDLFWFGPTWRIGLARHAKHLAQPLTLSVLPLRADTGISFDPTVQPVFEAPGAGVASAPVNANTANTTGTTGTTGTSPRPAAVPQVARVHRARLVPEYRLLLGPPRPAP